MGVRRPTGFVISKIMQDVWQLVRILTVLSFAHLPPWQVVICAVQTFHWLPPTPPTLRGGSEATRQGTPKLLALAFTQRDSSPGSGMWSSLSQQSVSEDEQAASLSCSRRAAHTRRPRQRDAAFRQWTTRTRRTSVGAPKPHTRALERASKRPQTHSVSRSRSDSRSSKCWKRPEGRRDEESFITLIC